jgi:hypothetical protein
MLPLLGSPRARLAVLAVAAAAMLAGAPQADAAPVRVHFEAPTLEPLATTRAVAAPRFVPIARLRARFAPKPLTPERRKRWRAAVASAKDYARHRLGRVSFAVFDDGGGFHGYHAARHYHSASVVKAMLLVAYLRRREVRNRRLSSSVRALLTPMIERSDNSAASRVYSIVGSRGLERVARLVRMRHFATVPGWSNTLIAAGDQSRLFFSLDRVLPPRHRGYARHLLRSVVSWQRWGIARALPDGARAYFKGGWRPENGAWLVHQAARVERGNRRVALAVLTDGDRSEGYGHETIRGVAARVLRGLGG